MSSELTPDQHFLQVLHEVAGVTEGYRVLDLTGSPCLTETVYDSAEAASACPIENRMILDAAKPWKTWYLGYDGARLIGEYPDFDSARVSMASAHVMLRITGPSSDLLIEDPDGRVNVASG